MGVKTMRPSDFGGAIICDGCNSDDAISPVGYLGDLNFAGAEPGLGF